jgi:hypothetical protein
MLRNTPAFLRAAGVLVLTGWVGAYLVLSSDTPPHGNDITWAFLLGVSLVAAGVVLASRTVQTRVPFLRPPTYELAGIVRRWRQCIDGAIDVLPLDEAIPESVATALRQLDSDSDRMIRKHFADWAPFYEHGKKPLPDAPTRRVASQWAGARYHWLRDLLNDLHGGREHGVV